MVWNKSGYHDRFTKEQMVIMDQRRKEEEQRKKEAEKKRKQAELQEIVVEQFQDE